jgi:hypothetical protein
LILILPYNCAMDTNAVIRTVERKILDRRYKSFQLLTQNRRLATCHLLKIFGSIHRSLNDPLLQNYDDVTIRMGLKSWIQGLEHSLRWVLKDTTNEVFTSDSWEVLDAQSLDLMTWGVNYGRLFTNHVAWSRGRLDAQCDADSKTIKFILRPENTDPTVLLSQATSELLSSASIYKSFPTDDISREYAKWKNRIELKSPIQLRMPEIAVTSDAFRSVRSWMATAVFPELPDHHELDGFSLGDFRQILASLIAISSCTKMLEDECDHVSGPENALGSPIIEFETEEMFRYVEQISGVDRMRASHVIKDLTFDPNLSRSSISTQPFINTETHLIALLRWFAIGDPQRMLTAGLLRGNRRKVYERFIQKVEQVNVHAIAELLQRNGYQVLTFEEVKLDNGRTITPDLIVYHPSDVSVAVIDYKHAIPPTNAAEVDEKMSELKKWYQQIMRYEQVRRSEHIRQRLGIKNKEYQSFHLFLLFRWPIVIPIEKPSEITLADWPTLEFNIQKYGPIPIPELVQFYSKLRHPVAVPNEWAVDYHSIKVGEWTYMNPIWSGKSLISEV